MSIDALAHRAATRTERRRHRTVLVDAEPSFVNGQPRQLLRSLDNALDNAAKFDPSGQPIEVVVRPGTITIRDHGGGIEPADLVRVFDRFYRTPSARSRPGSGLGLSIAHDIITRHGGSISATNHADGGAVITISLPIVETTPPEAEPTSPTAVGDGSPTRSHRTLT